MMNRSSSRIAVVALASALLGVFPTVANAQSAPSSPLSAEQVQSEFLNAGYQIDQAVHWDFSGVTTFRIQAPAGRAAIDGRVLMVLVYPDTATADIERERAVERQRMQSEGPLSIEQVENPILVPGYGPSTWRQNVGVVQSTMSTLERFYAAESDRENAAAYNFNGDTLARPSGPMTMAVDMELLTALDTLTATFNL
jgi:hypothetical protein